jgi:hypothetical protein
MAPDEPDREVLSSLPRTRPQRRSPRRDGAKKPQAKPAAATPRKAPAKPRPARKPRGAERRMPPAGFAAPRPEGDQGTPTPPELVGTAIQAAGELAQIGLAVGGHALRSAIGRLARREPL